MILWNLRPGNEIRQRKGADVDFVPGCQHEHSRDELLGGGTIARGGGDWLLPSFAASAIGGTLFTGGWVNVVGTFFGGLLLGTIENGLVLLGTPSFWVQMITGLVLLVAVILDRVRVVAVERSRMGAAQ